MSPKSSFGFYGYKMLRMIILLTIVDGVCFSGAARAQGGLEPRREDSAADIPPFTRSAGAAASIGAADVGIGVGVGIDGAFQIPLGALADGTGVGFGALLRGEYEVTPGLRAGLRAGYVYSLKKENSGLKTNVDDVPIWGGAKLFVSDILYLAAEIGVNMLKTHVEGTVEGISVSGSSSRDTRFGAGVGAGLRLAKWEWRVQFEVLDFDHFADSKALVANLGYEMLSL